MPSPRAALIPFPAGDRAAVSPADDEPGSPGAPVRFEPTPAGGPSRRAASAAPSAATPTVRTVESGLPDLSGETWRIAPIRWRGNTGTTGNAFSSPDGGSSLTLQNNLGMQLSSFIVAPYIAQWTGSFSTVSSQSQSVPVTGATVKSDSSMLNLGGSVSLFSMSNFPFSANISRSSSESRAGEQTDPAISLALGLRQQFRSADGRDNYAASYNRNSLTSGARNSVTSSLLGSYTGRRVVDDEESFLDGEHTLNASIGISPASSNATGEKSLQLNGSVSHGWRVHEDLSVNTSLTLANSQGDQFLGDTRVRNESTVFLGSSTFSYNFEDMPLTLSGGVNAGLTQSSFDGQQASLQNFGGNLSGQYRFSNNLSASGNASLGSIFSPSGNITFGSVGANVSYFGDTLKLGKFDYGWNVGAGASGSFSSGGSSSVGASANAGHTLMRNITLGDAQTISFSAGQSVSLNQTQFGQAASLSNNLGASWGARYGDALSLNLGASFSDSIGVGSGQSAANRYRAMNLTGSGSYQITSRAALRLNSNLNWSQSISGNEQSQSVNGIVIDNGNRRVTGNFSLGYTHSSPFSISNLNYSANALWASSQSSQRLAGISFIGNQSRTSISFQQNVDYRIGRLAFRLQHAMIDQDGRKSASIFGSVNREFGGFFDGRW